MAGMFRLSSFPMLSRECGGGAIKAGLWMRNQFHRNTIHQRLEPPLPGKALRKA